MIKIGFDAKNSTFVLFLCVVVGKKGLSIICKFKNLANTYLRKVIQFQGSGFCCSGVMRHWNGFR